MKDRHSLNVFKDTGLILLDINSLICHQLGWHFTYNYLNWMTTAQHKPALKVVGISQAYSNLPRTNWEGTVPFQVPKVKEYIIQHDFSLFNLYVPTNTLAIHLKYIDELLKPLQTA